jgi:hypothetical protein
VDFSIERFVDAEGARKKDLCRRAILEKNSNDAPYVFAHLITYGPRRIVRIYAKDRHRQFRERPIDNLFEDRALVLEVEIERAARDAGSRDDVFDLGRVIAPLREYVARVLQQLLSSLGLLHDPRDPAQADS